MTHCVYTTNFPWIEFLSSKTIRNNVNFWRSDKCILRLNAGAYFYFKESGPSWQIVGRGRFVEAKGNLTIGAAWKRFGVRNGYASQEQLRAAVAEEYGEDSPSHVNCNVLTNLEWLAEPFKIDKQFFPPQVEGPKCYADQEIEFVSQVFEQANETSAEFPPLVLVENDVTSEGKYDHWADATGEQYNFPNKYRNMIIEGRRFVYYRGVRRVGSRGGR